MQILYNLSKEIDLWIIAEKYLNAYGIYRIKVNGKVAGSGRFSILLAKHGCNVTHFDISQPMIDKAKELAERAGVLDKISFVKGALEDLKDFDDKSFDMVISFDAPVSYTYPRQEQIIGELVRICKKRIVTRSISG